jgi:hypothetical protein
MSRLLLFSMVAEKGGMYVFGGKELEERVSEKVCVWMRKRRREMWKRNPSSERMASILVSISP